MQAMQMNIKGIKCDASSCEYSDDDVKVEDYAAWLNKPCPQCGANLLTEADMKTVKIMLASAELVNALHGDAPDDSPTVIVDFKMDGSGKPNPVIVQDEPSRESDNKESV